MNVTATKDVKDSIINRLASIDLLSSQDLQIFDGSQPGSKNTTRHEKTLNNLSKIWAEIGNKELKTRFVNAARPIINEIGGLEGAKSALIAGARLIKNFDGSVENAKLKYNQLIQTFQAFPHFKELLPLAFDITMLLNRTTNTEGVTGSQLLFSLVFEQKFTPSNMIFESTKTKSLETMQTFFGAINFSKTSGFGTLMEVLAKEKIRLNKFRDYVSKLDDDRILVRNLRKYFDVTTTEEIGKKVRSALQSIRDISSTNEDLNEILKTVRDIYRSSNSASIFMLLSDISKLSRDARWLDSWSAFRAIHNLNNGPPSYPLSLAALFQDLYKIIKSNGSYREVFLALQMLMEMEKPEVITAKCKFIDSFYTGLQNIDNSIEEFGVITSDIHRWNEATISVDALVQLLKASGSLENLKKFLGYHNSYTTDVNNPNNSVDKIGDMIVYLEKNGYSKFETRLGRFKKILNLLNFRNPWTITASDNVLPFF